MCVVGEGGGGGKLKLGNAQGDAGSEGDGEIRRTEGDGQERQEERMKLGLVCVQGGWEDRVMGEGESAGDGTRRRVEN